jgi:hypothetical protein
MANAYFVTGICLGVCEVKNRKAEQNYKKGSGAKPVEDVPVSATGAVFNGADKLGIIVVIMIG